MPEPLWSYTTPALGLSQSAGSKRHQPTQLASDAKSFPLGAALGEADGDRLGETLGVDDGVRLGDKDGDKDGEIDGVPLGLGEAEGVPDGEALGLRLGVDDIDGVPDGDALGEVEPAAPYVPARISSISSAVRMSLNMTNSSSRPTH